ncbi:MAG: hypothetical protein D8M58_03345 [Calditrichaeota bacterium]|nr:MAG: hypothetical protein DWQ03_03730 [Calditrichota bacterium]MBL1204401.1 hypothetical protein [Calditrichota bacterium]NOG44230.1 hypothetical protein [Calditrichota bacterium]
MLSLRKRLESNKKLFVTIVALFTVVVGFSGFFHNHEPGVESFECPVFILQNGFSSEVAIGILFTFILFVTSFFSLTSSLSTPQLIFISIEKRGPPFIS